MKQRITDIT